MLIVNSPGLMRHSNTLHTYSISEVLLVNFYKREVTVFNTTRTWVTRSELEFFLGEEKVAHAHVTITNIIIQLVTKNGNITFTLRINNLLFPALD